MKFLRPLPRLLLMTALLSASLPAAVSAKGYGSGGGHSYSSHSSSSSSHSFSSSSGHSFSSGSSSGSSHSFSSGSSGSGSSSHSFGFGSSSGSSHSSSSGSSGSIFSSGHHSYSSGSSSEDSGSHSYSSGRSYSSGSGSVFSSGSSSSSSSHPRSSGSSSGSSSFSFDTAAAHARSEEASRDSYTHYRDSQNPTPPRDATPPPTYTTRSTTTRVYHQNVYIPDTVVFSTRPARIQSFFQPYYVRPIVRYNDPYSSLFWWWLLDRSLDDRAYWAYNHRYDMDSARYQALFDQDAQLQARVQQLESQQTPVDPNYVPPGLDRDLMYSDEHLQHVYETRPTTSGRVAFWLFGVPMACGVCYVFVWLMFFKRWNVSPQPIT
jgi:hypothetical protein